MIAAAALDREPLPLPRLPRAGRVRHGPGAAAVSVVVLYGRPGCCLCDEARSVLQRVRARAAVRADRGATSSAMTHCCAPTWNESRWSRWTARSCSNSPSRSRSCETGSLESARMIEEQSAAAGEDLAASAERLSLGVAARLSRYLQVLTQARKMGRETISSHELAEYTHVNSTQIRRDLSGFGKFGKRGVGYNVDSLRGADPQDPAHRGPAQHRAVRRRPPRHGDRLLGDLRRPRLPRRGDLRR